MKRILVLDRFYFPDEQPTSIYLTELTEALQNQFQFEILSGPPLIINAGGSFYPALRFTIHRAPCPHFSKKNLLARFFNDSGFLISAFFHGLFVKHPDLIFSQTSPPGLWGIAFLLKLWHRSRWIQVCQDIFPDNLTALTQSSGIFVKTLGRISDFILKKADHIIVIGEDMKERVLQKGFLPSKVLCIPNWVDADFIRPLPKKNSFSKKHHLDDKFVVLYPGNFGRIYNFDDVLNAARELKPYPQIVFVLAGEGAAKEKLIEESEREGLENILFLPFQPRSILPEMLASADIGLVLLKREMAGLSVPSKIYSLLASGRALLACAEEKSDVARLVRESQAGFSVSPGDPKELAQKILVLYQDEGLKQQLGKNARAYAEEKNFQASAFRDYERVFEQVLQKTV